MKGKKNYNPYYQNDTGKKSDKYKKTNDEPLYKKNERGKSNYNQIMKMNNNLKKSNFINTQRDKIIQNLLESKIGLINAGGSCYMASIIQILIHSKLFLEEFYKNKNVHEINPLSKLFSNFIEKIASFEGSFDSIEIKNFAQEFNKINYKFSGDKGNNPMTFFTEFIKKLSEKKNDILKLFMGKRYMNFKGMSELNYEEDFIFYLIVLNKKNYFITTSLCEEKEFEDNKDLKLIEKITVKPETLIINLEFNENIEYNIENWIKVDDVDYELKAVNRYNDYHSTA